MKKGNFSALLTEALGLILIFLLPLKFGTIIGLPSVNLSYPASIVSLLFSSLPAPLFSIGSVLFLGMCLFSFGRTSFSRLSVVYSLLLMLLALAAVPGAFASGTVFLFSLQYLTFFLSAAAFGTGLILMIENDETVINHILTVFFFSFLFSLYSGLNQYFTGFDDTLAYLNKNNLSEGAFNGGIRQRLLEHRVSADFSSCNAYAGYLVLQIPIIAGLLWRFGGRVEPAKAARPLVTAPVTAAALFLLVKTGCRGALLSLAAAVIIIVLILPVRRKWKVIPAALIPIGIICFSALILLGRGAKSLLFRLDYLQGAFRMMLESPLTGKGWGNFQNAFFTYKMILDKEAPASPHNFLLTFGANSGISAFLISAAVLAVPLWFGMKKLIQRKAEVSFSDDYILETAVITGFLAWSIHSMQDILLETPGCAVTAIAAACIIICRTGNDTPAKSGKILFVPAIVLLVAAGCMSIRYFRYDFAYSELSDTADIRTIAPEKIMKTDMAEVQKLYDKCEKLEPASPFHDMLFSDFLFARRETDPGFHYLNQALRKNPGSAALHFRKYRFFLHMNRTAEAQNELETAHRLAPQNPLYSTGAKK